MAEAGFNRYLIHKALHHEKTHTASLVRRGSCEHRLSRLLHVLDADTVIRYLHRKLATAIKSDGYVDLGIFSLPRVGISVYYSVSFDL